MAKMARTCKWASPRWRCAILHKNVFDCESKQCYESRTTPLLVDELAEILDAILAALTGNWFSYTKLPGKIENAETEAEKLIGRAYAALARYQKEVGDDKA